MKLKSIVIATSMLLGTTAFSYADVNSSTGTLSSTLDSVGTSAKQIWDGATQVTWPSVAGIKAAGNSVVPAFKGTWGSLTNEGNTWGSQDRTGQWYLGVQTNVYINNVNSNGSNLGWNGIIGYNFNKYIGIQYNQFAAYNGMFGGLAEGVINLSNNTMFTPYAAGGAGWANLAGNATGGWDVGGGLKFELSKSLQASLDYRYIQTMAPNPMEGLGLQPNARAGVNMLGAGLTWYFGGDQSSTPDTSNIQDSAKPTIDVTKYVLPKGIKQCVGNFNLTKDGVACYTVHGDNVTVYLDSKFAYDSATLNPKGKAAISSFVNFVKNNNIGSVTVRGYASQGKTGARFEAYNQKLSERRAEAVADYMQQLGLSKNKIITKGFGYYDTLPGVAKNASSNRRVQASVAAPLKQEK